MVTQMMTDYDEDADMMLQMTEMLTMIRPAVKRKPAMKRKAAMKKMKLLMKTKPVMVTKSMTQKATLNDAHDSGQGPSTTVRH
jgi:hypothetical protein